AASSGSVVNFKLAFSEHQPMGYMTTDFWANYDRVWLQPMYILVIAWDDKPPAANRLVDENMVPVDPIFSIGPQSAFYSPFWSTFYVVVPATTPPGKYTSARQLFEATRVVAVRAQHGLTLELGHAPEPPRRRRRAVAARHRADQERQQQHQQ